MLRSRYLKLYFNPRTPCGVRRLKSSGVPLPKLFQSTHPLRGATERRRQQHHDPRYFNPRTPCGVRHQEAPVPASFLYFNPRTPCGVRPGVYVPGRGRGNISIHAPLAGCDAASAAPTVTYGQFQSTHPLRGATRWKQMLLRKAIFQSTHPLRGATILKIGFRLIAVISIHAPLAGCDSWRAPLVVD